MAISGSTVNLEASVGQRTECVVVGGAGQVGATIMSGLRSEKVRPPRSRAAPGILPSALRASLWLLPIAPGDWVGIDVITCVHCGDAVRIVASIEEPTAIRAA